VLISLLRLLLVTDARASTGAAKLRIAYTVFLDLEQRTVFLSTRAPLSSVASSGAGRGN